MSSLTRARISNVCSFRQRLTLLRGPSRPAGGAGGRPPGARWWAVAFSHCGDNKTSDAPAGRRPRPPDRRGPAGRVRPKGRRTAPAHAGDAGRAPLRQHAADLWAVGLVTLGVLLALALYGRALGPVGHGVDVGLGQVVGWARYVVPPVCVVAGVLIIAGRRRPDPLRVVVGTVLGLLAVCGLAELAGGSPRLGASGVALRGAGGWLGVLVGRPLQSGIGTAGTAVLLVAVCLVAVIVATGVDPRGGGSGPGRGRQGGRPRRGTAGGRAASSSAGDRRRRRTPPRSCSSRRRRRPRSSPGRPRPPTAPGRRPARCRWWSPRWPSPSHPAEVRQLLGRTGHGPGARGLAPAPGQPARPVQGVASRRPAAGRRRRSPGRRAGRPRRGDPAGRPHGRARR